jgi:hypothetical protein
VVLGSCGKQTIDHRKLVISLDPGFRREQSPTLCNRPRRCVGSADRSAGPAKPSLSERAASGSMGG